MFGDLKALFASVAGGAVVFFVMLLFYEGIPLGPARDVPIFGTVAEALFDGRVDRQRRAGAHDERIKWQELRDRQIAQNAARLVEAQKKVDGWSRRYLDKEAELLASISQKSALEDALAQSKKEAEDAANSQDLGKPVCPPRPAISRGVSRELNKMGR